MKRINVFLMILPFMLGLISCNTEDLQKDIDNLKDRVENLEAQVLLLNENLNALKVFVDGNKTIQSYTESNGTYKLLLSDGSEITLTQGSQGVVKIPDITINENGEWVVNGVVLEGSSANGSDAETPKFGIDADKHWTIDFGNGPEKVLGADGKPVEATTDGNINVEDPFFTEVKVDGGMMIVKYKDGNTYSLPIVEDLICEIVDPSENFKNGVLSVGYGKTVELIVKVSGDNYAVTAPAGWTAVLGEVVDGTATLSVTAPLSNSPLSRATADNTKDLVLQVNKGVTWAIDKIQVEAIKVIESYYAEYIAGRDIIIGMMGDRKSPNAMIVNKITFPEDKVVYVESDQEIKEDDKIYFVKEGVTVTYNMASKISSLVVIGDKQGAAPTLKTTKILSLDGKTASGKGIAMLNMVLDASEHTNYVININDQADGITYDYLYLFDNCRIYMPVGKNLAYINNKDKVKVSNIGMYNTYVEVPASGNPILASIGGKYQFNTLTMFNNVFYSPQPGKGVEKFTILAAADVSSNFTQVDLINNTFINLLGANVYAKAVIKGGLNAKNNLIWNDLSLSSTTYIVQAIKESDISSVTIANYFDNKVYSKNNLKNMIFHTSGNVPVDLEGKNNLQNESSDPFVDGIFDWEKKVFVPGTGYENIGAHID